MQNDHLEDAILFIRSALGRLADGYPVSRHDLERAIEEIEAFRADQEATKSFKRYGPPDAKVERR